ncbi:glutamate synthase subunit beta [Treponema sp. OttesenSCG-928-L16]|nr:glutamate synthase subunit beta [Treponema sp. OttesenSCG-928-L16]
MAKPTGFLEYPREDISERPMLQRIGDYNDFHIHPEEKTVRIQAARCMNCGVPFCHTGKILSPGATGCPLNNLIPEWNDLVYRSCYREAYERLSLTSPFPEFTSRVCPALCEGSCTAGMDGQAVSVKQNERFIIDHALEQGYVIPRPKALPTGRRVAVIGAGPAGLACADMLNQLGHGVRVFEREDHAGGLLMYGIPNMKLEKSMVKNRVSLLEQEGISFVCNTEINETNPVENLLETFDSVVLCCGAAMPRRLEVPGSDLKGIYYAVDYLKASTKALLGLRENSAIDAAGKDVIIIGGGDTGTDCAATAIRQGCKSVRQIEIMPSLPGSRGPDNPWPGYPRLFKTDYGQKEAIFRFGSDPRLFETMVTELSGDPGGTVCSVSTVRLSRAKDDAGRPVPLRGFEKKYPAGLVIIAMGFTGPDPYMRTFIDPAKGIYRTKTENIFTAGDMRRGPSLVVWAIQEGREAARCCDRYLREEGKEV